MGIFDLKGGLKVISKVLSRVSWSLLAALRKLAESVDRSKNVYSILFVFYSKLLEVLISSILPVWDSKPCDKMIKQINDTWCERTSGHGHF